MHFDQAAVEREQEIFAMTRGAEDVASLGQFREPRGRLGLGNEGMKNVHAANAASADERKQAASYGFDFGKFRHVRLEVTEESKQRSFRGPFGF